MRRLISKILGFLFLLIATQGWAVTRYYITQDVLQSFNPQFRGAWSDTLQGQIRLPLTISTDGTTMSSIQVLSGEAVAKDSILVFQAISGKLAAQIISGATLKGQIRGLESHTAANGTVAICAYIVSKDDSLCGFLINTSASDGTATPPELAAALTNRQFQDGAEATPLSLATVEVPEEGYLVVEIGIRENTTTARSYDLSVGNNSATDLPEDNTTTAANNPWIEISQTLVDFSPPSGWGTHNPLQPPHGCNVMGGDTLYPYVDGDSIGLSATATPHADFLDEAPNSAGCGSANDSIWQSGNSNNRDYFYMRTARSDSVWSTFRGSRANDQIDCIAIVACLRRQNTFGATRDGFVQLGIMDSSSGSRYYFTGPEWSLERNTARQVFTFYIPNKPSATEVLGSARWDSASLAGLQLRIKLRTTNAGDSLALFNIYVLVFASSRDTSVADSTNSDMQSTAMATGFTLQMNRQSAFFESNVNKQRLWLGALNNSSTEWILTASDDTGRTWTYIANTGDSVTIRDASEGLGAPGLFLFGGKDAASDSFRIASMEAGGLDTCQIYLTKRNQTTGAELSARLDTKAVPTNGGVAVQYQCLYQYKDTDTLWEFEGAATSSGRLRWHRSKDGGQTWPDSGYIQGPGAAYTDAGTQAILTTSGSRRLGVIRWTDGYPAIFTTGWSINGNIVRFQYWHPAVTNADSMRLHAFFRADNTTTCDTLRLNTEGGNNNSGELAATSAYIGGNPFAYCVYIRGNRIKYGRINNSLGVDTGYVVEISQVRLGTSPYFISLTAKDTAVYCFFNYQKVAGTTDSQDIYWSLYCGGGWRGPRPLSWANGIKVQHRFPSTSPYQSGNMAVAGWLTTTRTGSTYQEVYANRIVKPSNPAAGGQQIPLRRRRLIIEKQYRTGSLDENTEDNLPAWAGLRLPDWDDTEK